METLMMRKETLCDQTPLPFQTPLDPSQSLKDQPTPSLTIQMFPSQIPRLINPSPTRSQRLTQIQSLVHFERVTASAVPQAHPQSR